MPERDALTTPPPGGRPGARASRIGGFEILERLADGPMGTVYKARQADTKRLVALRVLPIRLAIDGAYVQRFLRDARAAARLSHPNIVAALDVGQADGCHYLATEHVDGVTLRDRLRQTGRIAQNEALQIAAHVAVALQHAHERGMVHRHITPANILIARDGQVKLADMGLARPTDAADALTSDDAAVITPHYVAPEQVSGATDLDIRADIYALGAVLYHMVTGQPPYDGPSAAAILAKHVAGPFPSAKEKNLRLSNDVSRLIATMTAKDPAQRPQTPAALLALIRGLGEGPALARPSPSVVAQPPPPPAEAAPAEPATSPRTKQALLLGALGLVGLLVLVILLATRERDDSQKLDDAQKALTEAEAYLTEHPDDLEGALERLRAVQADYPGTEAGDGAAIRIQELESQVAQAELRRQLAELRARIGRLIAADRFAEANRELDDFARERGAAKLHAPLGPLKQRVRDAAERRLEAEMCAADKALAKDDFPAARACAERVKAFGIPELTKQADAKLQTIDARAKTARLLLEWAKVKNRVVELRHMGKPDEAKQELGAFETALQKLADSQARPIQGIDKVKAEIAAQQHAIETARRAAAEEALAAYETASARVWALFTARKYADANARLKELDGQTKHPLARERLAADLEAAKLLIEFWAAVENGLAAQRGKRVTIGGMSGTVVEAADGMVTLKAGRALAGLRLVRSCTPDQAVQHAALGQGARADLARAVFLIAEDHDPAAVVRSLAAAGDARYAPEFRRRHRTGPVRLFDGKSLGHWKPLRSFRVEPSEGTGRCGKVVMDGGAIRLDKGDPLTGMVWRGRIPPASYELCLDAKRLSGKGAFATMILPLGRSHFRLGVGGWGCLGVGRVDGRDYNANLTRRRVQFQNGQWYHLRVRVTKPKIEVWLDEEKVVDLPRAGRAVSLSEKFDSLKPLGVYAWNTQSAVRPISIRPIKP